MDSQRKWFALRFTAGIMLCASIAAGYGFFTSWHATHTARTATLAAADRLQDCAQSPDDGRSLNDVLTSCGVAAEASDAAAQALHRSAQVSDRLASSRILFVRTFVPPTTTLSMNGLAERLAVFAGDLGNLAAWWPTTAQRLTALDGYNATSDLAGTSALQEPHDLIRRLYLAKYALQLIRTSLDDPVAAEYDARIDGIPAMLALIDKFIVATDDGQVTASDALRLQYIAGMDTLARRSASVHARIERQLQSRPWSSAAHDFAQHLRQGN